MSLSIRKRNNKTTHHSHCMVSSGMSLKMIDRFIDNPSFQLFISFQCIQLLKNGLTYICVIFTSFQQIGLSALLKRSSHYQLVLTFSIFIIMLEFQKNWLTSATEDWDLWLALYWRNDLFHQKRYHTPEREWFL